MENSGKLFSAIAHRPTASFIIFCRLPFNFPHVGATHPGELTIEERKSLQGWSIDRTRSRVGSGREAYTRAVDALLSWRHFSFDWAFTNAPKLQKDAPVVVIAKSLFLWSMNPLKITAIEKDGPPKGPTQKAVVRRRCGFAHTTVAGHQISGEERFTVEWRKDDDSVWYEVYTVSKPATLIAAVARPVLRFYQRKFVQESVVAMKMEANKGK